MGKARPRVSGALGAVIASAWLVALAVPARPAGAQSVSPVSSTPIITLDAGNGQPGFGGDGSPATSSMLHEPTGVAEDITGNLFIGDSKNNRVRKVATSGIVSTVAGDGVAGFSGDGGTATAAALHHPTGLALDSAGDLFIADTANNRVRKVNGAGVITTYAGDGNCPDEHRDPEHVDAAAGVSDTQKAHTGDGGPAVDASLCRPAGLAVDTDGSLYIADTGHNTVRKVDPLGVITTYAGTRAVAAAGLPGDPIDASFKEPTGLAFDAFRALFVADTGHSKIRKISRTGVVTTVAGRGGSGFSGDGGPAALAKLDGPSGLGIDPIGNLYISDTGNNRIRVITLKGDIFTYAGTGVAGYSGDGGPAAAARLNTPTGAVAVDGNNVFFADTRNQRIRRIQGGPPPNIPETPFALAALPLSALLVVGLAVYVVRRRRSAASPA
jgi:sugar lactone lactonase YvrE